MNYEKTNSYDDLKTFFSSEEGSGMTHYIEQKAFWDDETQKYYSKNAATIMCMKPSNKDSIRFFQLITDDDDYTGDFTTNYIETGITELCINSSDAESRLISKV